MNDTKLDEIFQKVLLTVIIYSINNFLFFLEISEPRIFKKINGEIRETH